MRKTLFTLLIILGISTCLFSQTQIAVLDFIGKNVNTDEASALSDRLGIEMYRTGKFRVIEREKIDEILEEQGFQLSGCTSTDCAIQIGKLAQVERVVAGSISRVGAVFSIAARIIDVESGEILKTAIYDYEGNIGKLLLTGMQKVAEELAGEANPVATIVPEKQQTTQVSRESKADNKNSQVIAPSVTKQNQPKPKINNNESYSRSKRKISFGLLAGPNTSGVIGEDISEFYKPRPMAFNFGTFFSYSINKNLQLRLELFLCPKGHSYEINEFEIRHYRNYLELPVLVQFNFPNTKRNFFMYLGASGGTLLSDEYSYFQDGEEINIDLQGLTHSNMPELTPGESVFILGSGFHLSPHITTEFRMDIGTTPIYENEEDISNMSVTFLFGFILPFK